MDGEEDPEMSMLRDPVVGKFAREGTEEMSLFSWLASFGRMDKGKILILMAYKFLTRWEDRRAPWRVVGGKGWGRGFRDVHAPVVVVF